MTISLLIALIFCGADTTRDHDLAFPDYSVEPMPYRVSSKR